MKWAIAADSSILFQRDEGWLRREALSYLVNSDPASPHHSLHSFDGTAVYAFSADHQEGQIEASPRHIGSENPLLAVGLNLSDVYLSAGTHTALADLVLQLPVQEEGGEFVIRNAGGGPAGSPGPPPLHPIVQDVRFRLSPEAGYLPIEIWIVQRTQRGEDRWYGLKVHEFVALAAGVSFPVDYSCFRAGTGSNFTVTRYLVDRQSLEVNPLLDQSEFAFRFPPGASYTDWRTREFFNGRTGERVSLHAVPSEQKMHPTNAGNAWFKGYVVWGNLIAAAIVLSIIVWRNRRATLILVLGSGFTVAGCMKTSTLSSEVPNPN